MQDKIKLNENEVIEVQKANVEMEAKRGVLAFMITSGTSLEDENYKKYEESYTASFKEFERLKHNIETTYVKSKYPNAINWSLDYNTNELLINY